MTVAAESSVGAAWVALGLGLAALVVGVLACLTLFFIWIGAPLLAYARVRIIWGIDRLVRRRDPSRSIKLSNVRASVCMIAALLVVGVALWPGQAIGYEWGAALGVAELGLGVVSFRHLPPKPLPAG